MVSIVSESIQNVSCRRRCSCAGMMMESAEGYYFRGLAEEIVLIGILQGVDAVTARCHAAYGEVAPAVGAPHALERQGGEGRVGQVGMQSHEDALHRFEVGGVEHGSCHGHGVEAVAGGEREGEALQGVAFVVVLYGVGKVDGVGGGGLQRVLQCDDDALAVVLHLGLLALGRAR